MKVLLVVAYPDRQPVVELALPEGSTVADALAAARRDAQLQGVELEGLRTGIWSRPCTADTPLREGDRVELYRELRVDPKQARRARAKAKTAR